MSSTLKYTGEDTEFKFFEDYFQEFKIRISVRKLDGEVFFNADDFAKAMGFENHKELIKSQEAQEALQMYIGKLMKGGVA